MLNSIQSKLLIPVILFTIVSMIAGFFYISSIKNEHIELVGFSTATAVARQVKNLRSFYRQTIVNRVRKSGVKIHHDYLNDDKTIPFPDTLVNILEKSFEKEYPGASMHLYSRFPFQNNSEAEIYDSFELEALSTLEQNPSKPYFKLERIDDALSLQYAVPDIMKDSCVQCHNTHPESPKQDWKAGDVRGALEVTIPLGDADSISRTMALRLFGFIGIPLFGMILITALVYRRTVIRPINSISDTNERIRSGDLKARAIVYSRDEFGVMASGFNILIDRLLNLVETKEAERDDMQDSIMKLL